MNWFGRKSAGRDESRPALARGWSLSVAERPWSYEDGVRTGYLVNPVAQRAVRLVAEGVGSVPLTGAVAEAVALVGTRTAGQALLETVAMQLLLHGLRVIGWRSAPGCGARERQPVQLMCWSFVQPDCVPDEHGSHAAYGGVKNDVGV